MGNGTDERTEHDEQGDKVLVERFTISSVDAGGTSRGSVSSFDSYGDALAEGERVLRDGEAESFSVQRRYELDYARDTDSPDADDDADPFAPGEETGAAVPHDGDLGGDDSSLLDPGADLSDDSLDGAQDGSGNLDLEDE